VKCTTCRRLLAPLSEGTLSARRARRVEDHLVSCPDCREESQAAEGIAAALHDFRPTPLEPALRTALTRRVAHAARTAAKEPPRGWIPLGLRSLLDLRTLAPVAATLLVGAIGLGVWQGVERRSEPAQVVVQIVFGEVEQRGVEGESWRPVRAGDALPLGSRLLCREKGMLVFKTDAGDSVTLGPQTVAQVVESSTISVERGTTLIEPRGSVNLMTPAGSLRTRGGRGELYVAVDNDVQMVSPNLSVAWETPSGFVEVPAGLPMAQGLSGEGLRPMAWDAEPWSWLEILAHMRAREVLRETHPSLLPSGR
jgi:hypothetical protein